MKRVNQSARSVIGPDPTLRLDEIAVPHEIADNLSYPELVSRHNIDYLLDLVKNDGANHVMRKNKTHIMLKYALTGDKKDKFTLEEGDVVERKLQDGDILLLNRQPTKIWSQQVDASRVAHHTLLDKHWKMSRRYNYLVL